MIRIALRRGAQLSILDQPLDAHQMVRLAEPRLQMPGPKA